MADVTGLSVGWANMLAPAGTPTFANHTLDATTDGYAISFQAINANAITHIGFRYGARTGTPPTYVATLEGVSATTGLPDGTDVGGGSATAKTFTPPADATWNGTWQWIQLTNAYTPSRGQLLCFTIRYSSGTVDASNFSTFTTDLGSTEPPTAFPSSYRLTAGTWAIRAVPPVGAVRTASERYGNPIEALYNTRSASTVGHRVALKFTLPAGSGDTFKVRGLRFCGSVAGAVGKNPIVGLWSASAAVQTVTLDSDIVSSPTTSYRLHEVYFDEASLTAINFGTAYYLGLEVADAVNGGVLMNGWELDSSSELSAFGGGSNWHLATYDGATWSDVATVRPMAEVIFDDMTEPAAGGGGLLQSNMRAGMMA